MAVTATTKKPATSIVSAADSLDDLLSSRESRELVISLCGPVGSGIGEIKKILEDCFREPYSVVPIKISELIKEAVVQNQSLSRLRSELPNKNSSRDDHISKLQNVGNELRGMFGNEICAALAIQKIAMWRGEYAARKGAPVDRMAVSKSTVYIVDQLKHPEESALFDKVYGSTHYQLGVFAGEDDKVNSLMKEKIPRAKAVALIEEDRRQNKKHGQQLEKTLSYSNYFINASKNLQSLKNQIQRFIDLIHGKVGITPTHDEVGMNAAYTASLRSACLSRQVGAAICDDGGNVLAVGRNDVPKFGGGLYTAEDGENDKRCVHHGGKCYNTERIKYLKEDIKKILLEFFHGDASEKEPTVETTNKIENAIDRIEKETDVGSLIEFSRAIHAEMDAITSMARNSSYSTKGTTLYTTTYPCHGCARHIVAAGIKRVVYIEPYPKSLASSLHDDALQHGALSPNHVRIEPFQGAAPKSHRIFFGSKADKKDSQGNAKRYLTQEKTHVDAMLLSTYVDTESKITEFVTNLLCTSE